MASYFDEHGCVPLEDGQAPDHLLQLARYILTSGHWENDENLARMLGLDEKLPPPASKEFMENLEEVTLKDRQSQCPICLKVAQAGQTMICLPCSHEFDRSCLDVWLKKTNSCPMCRKEYPTDDADYEELRRQKKRAKERAKDLEILHNSMFS